MWGGVPAPPAAGRQAEGRCAGRAWHGCGMYVITELLLPKGTSVNKHNVTPLSEHCWVVPPPRPQTFLTHLWQQRDQRQQRGVGAGG